MARKNKQESTEKKPLELLISIEEARIKIEDRISKGKEIKEIVINSQDELNATNNNYRKWDDYNVEMLQRMFTSEEIAQDYEAVYSIFVTGGYVEEPLNEKLKEFHDDVDEKIHRLESTAEKLDLIPVSKCLQKHDVMTDKSIFKAKSNKVFIVHGHDEDAKNELDIFLRENHFEPIILHRQADKGCTLIEKLEAHSDVGYVFIILTPDEVAYLKEQESKPDEERQKEFRARPNVIFEFGFFVGKLGRKNVCCLYKQDVTLPSDVSGIIYKEYNKKVKEIFYDIINELKACGYKLS